MKVLHNSCNTVTRGLPDMSGFGYTYQADHLCLLNVSLCMGRSKGKAGIQIVVSWEK